MDTIQEIDLGKIQWPLRSILQVYKENFFKGFHFGEIPDLSITEKKPYTAKTDIPVMRGDETVGNLVTLVFFPGDGTGSDITYQIKDLNIPLDLRFGDKQERVLPRKKEIYCEGCLPFYSFDANLKKGYSFAPFAISLDELTVKIDPGNKDSLKIVPAYKLGVRNGNFKAILNGNLAAEPVIYFTTGYDENGNRFGDPHAIHYSINDPKAIQVAGFLSIEKKDSPLIELTPQWRMPNLY